MICEVVVQCVLKCWEASAQPHSRYSYSVTTVQTYEKHNFFSSAEVCVVDSVWWKIFPKACRTQLARQDSSVCSLGRLQGDRIFLILAHSFCLPPCERPEDQKRVASSGVTSPEIRHQAGAVVQTQQWFVNEDF